MDAIKFFYELDKPDAFSWNSIISAHTKYGLNDKAIQLFQIMRNSFIEPNGHVMVAVLKPCTSAESIQGKSIHAQVISVGFASNIYALQIPLLACMLNMGTLNMLNLFLMPSLNKML